MSKLKNIIKKLLLSATPMAFQRLIVNAVLGSQKIELSNIHFSQEGEDVILDKFFFDKKNGFYVDIGAHHPSLFSNTYKYYLKGWNGINVDAMPGSMNLFKEKRPRDINLEFGISSNEGLLPFYVFDQATLNTFNKEQAEDHVQNMNATIKHVVNVPTFPLYKVLDQHVSENRQIDFMSIDVEGLDFEVLTTNNWEKYKPSVILVEDIGASIDDVLKSSIYKLLSSKGYKFICKTFHTNIYHTVDQ